MYLKLLLVLLLSYPVMAENLFYDWPNGKTEKLTYSITTFGSVAGKSTNNIEISKVEDSEDYVIEVIQIIDITDQAIKIKSLEQYDESGSRLKASVNNYLMDPDIGKKMGFDSLLIKADPIGDSLEITTSTTKIPSNKLSMERNLVTGIGAMLLARGRDYEIDQAYCYNQVNLLTLSNEGFKAVAVVDSVIGEEIIATGIGNFKCIKVMKTMPDLVAVSYYYKDFSNLPVLIEGFDRNSRQRTMTITLTGYQVVSE